MRLLAMLFMIAIILPISTMAQTSQEASFSSSGSAATVLIEEHTATYCITCAEIDPMLLTFLEDNGNRAIRIAMHPLGEDPLGSNISSHRLTLHGGELSVTPTFVMDGRVVSQGFVDRIDMQMNLRSSEITKEGVLSIKGEVDVNQNTLRVTSPGLVLGADEHLTIFIVEREAFLKPGTASNGLDKNHDVARAMLSMEVGGNTSSEILPEGWSVHIHDTEVPSVEFFVDEMDPYSYDVVIVLEKSEGGDGSVLSSTLVALSERSEAGQYFSTLPIVAALASMSIILFIVQSRR
ncbi:MAG: hypothetical protein CBD52_000880 [Euryarchaeota archaeon TMED192]|nr:MAG: hypothetical protein CBD52_000880 [Euryarchaeota archaeon TMED192]